MHFQALLSKLVSCLSLWSQYLSLWHCNSRLTLIGSSEKCAISQNLHFLLHWTGWLPWLSFSNLSSQGSVVVFGAYSTWTYEEAVDETFCDYTCFMFAFVLLILRWVKRDKPSSSWLPLFFPGHNALRHLLWLHEADVQGLPQGPPGQLRWKFWNPVQFSSKRRTYKITL